MPVSKPYLERMDHSPDGVHATLQWVAYLGETFGATAALNCLQYYERIGWINRDVRRTMTTYLQGLSLAELHNKTYDDPVSLEGALESLSASPFSAHAQSLQYIADIANDDLEEHVLVAELADRRIERERDDDGDHRIPMVDGGRVRDRGSSSWHAANEIDFEGND